MRSRGCRCNTLPRHAAGHGHAWRRRDGKFWVRQGCLPLLREATCQGESEPRRWEVSRLPPLPARVLLELIFGWHRYSPPCVSLCPTPPLSISLPPHMGTRTKVGVAFAKGYRVVRLWGVEEEGSFPTLERSLQGSSMKKTLPRTFGPADPHFTDCRGVVLSNEQTGEKVRVKFPERLFSSATGVIALPNTRHVRCVFRACQALVRTRSCSQSFELRSSSKNTSP